MTSTMSRAVVDDIRQTRQMIRSGGREAMRRWAPPSPGELKALRGRLGLSQAQFCERYGLDLKSLQHWEQEQHSPEQVTCMFLSMIEEDPDEVAVLVDRVRLKHLEPA